MITEHEYFCKNISHALTLMDILFYESGGQCILKCGWCASIKRWVVCSDCEVCFHE